MLGLGDLGLEPRLNLRLIRGFMAWVIKRFRIWEAYVRLLGAQKNSNICAFVTVIDLDARD